MRILSAPLWIGVGGALVGAVLLATMHAPPSRGAAPTTHRVTIENFAFEPANLEVRLGDRVEWINRDAAPHTATDEGGAWDTGELVKNADAAVTFSQAGAFSYLCSFHPNMRGEIIVVSD